MYGQTVGWGCSAKEKLELDCEGAAYLVAHGWLGTHFHASKG